MTTAAPAPRARRANREDIAQRAVLSWLRITYHPVWEMTFHVPNGGRRGAVEAAILNGQGVKAGVSDLVSLYPWGGYHGILIEMKAEKPHASPVSDAQRWWLEQSTARGYFARACKGYEEAIAVYTELLGNPAQHRAPCQCPPPGGFRPKPTRRRARG